MTVQQERRRDIPGGCDPLEACLNGAQRVTLQNIESFGWELKFIRRPEVELAMPVVFGPDGKTIGVLEQDGRLNINIHLSVRE